MEYWVSLSIVGDYMLGYLLFFCTLNVLLIVNNFFQIWEGLGDYSEKVVAIMILALILQLF